MARAMSSSASRSTESSLKGDDTLFTNTPDKSRAWEMPELTELMMHPEIGSVVLHMCAFGMVA